MLNWADYALLLVLAVSMGIGLWRGFVVEVLSLTVWIAAFWLSVAFGDTVAAWFGGIESVAARMFLGYAAVFLGVLIAGGKIDPEEQARFSSGLVDFKQRQGLYKEDMNGVSISEQVLYQARISLPSNVTTGTYTAETFAVADGRVVSSAVAEVEVRKVGFERLVEIFSQENSFFYGLLAVALSVSMGWMAGRLFALV